MFDLNDVRAEYDRLDALCGVDSRGLRLTVSRRAKKRLGCFLPGAQPEVRLSAFIFADEALFWETIRHEYAHAVLWLRAPRERHAHDAAWKSLCREIGCTPRATAPAEMLPPEVRTARYVLRCCSCGAQTRYQRWGKFLRLAASGRAGALRCRRCGGGRFAVEAL